VSGAHARLSASAAHRWLHCAGSVNLSAGKNSTSEYAAAGTFAHSIAADCLQRDLDPQDFLGRHKEVDGFAVECTEEMVEAVKFYVDWVINQITSEAQHACEVPLLEALQEIDPDLGGTADYVIYTPETKHMHVIDFKYGSGTYVEADDSEQLRIYAFGAMLSTKRPVKNITVTIVQPRFEGAKPVRSWTFKAVNILEFIADIKAAADKTRLSDPPLVSGDHCKFCPARADCPKLKEHQTELMANDFAELVPYDLDALAQALTNVPLVAARIKAIEEFAYAEATRGIVIPGYKLVAKRPVRRWKSEGDVMEWAQENAVDAFAPRELLSPAQLEKKLG